MLLELTLSLLFSGKYLDNGLSGIWLLLFPLGVNDMRLLLLSLAATDIGRTLGVSDVGLNVGMGARSRCGSLPILAMANSTEANSCPSLSLLVMVVSVNR